MRIAFFTENTHAGGLDSILISLVNNWPHEADELTIICNEGHPGLKVIEKRLKRPCRIVRHKLPVYSYVIEKLQGLPLFSKIRRFLFPVRYMLFGYYLFALRRILGSHSYDRLMVVAGGYPGGDTCRAAAVTWGISNSSRKAVFNFHNLAHPLGGWHSRIPESVIDLMMGHYTKRFVSVSNASAGSMVNRPRLWSTGKVSFIYNGVGKPENKDPGSSSFKEEMGIDPDSMLCLMMGTYEPRKGHEFLLSSFDKVVKRMPSAHLVICGYGRPGEVKAVEELVKRYELAANVHLLGFRNDLPNMLNSTDVMLVPSQSFESFGLTCVEAMSYHVPVVATRVGGLPEVVIDGEGGYCLPPDDSHGYAKCILKLLGDDSLRKEQGEKGYLRYRNNFTAERMAAEYADSLYGEVREHSEAELFLRWLKSGNLLKALKFYSLKAGRRIHGRIDRSPLRYYPKAVRDMLPLVTASGKTAWSLSFRETDLSSGYREVSSIKLASRTIELTGSTGIDWQMSFDDPEDEESLHRWNWMLTLLTENREAAWDLVPWVSTQIEKWFDIFLSDIRSDNCNSPKWESYTVGERISNTILFYYITKTAPSGKIIEGTGRLVEFLVRRLEYKGSRTGNHVLNNARAIYLAGAALGVQGWKDLGSGVIMRELPQLVTKDGFLREGSSHYQFLFTRWILEVHHFAGLAKESGFAGRLRPYIKGLVRGSEFFLVYNSEKGSWDIPLFGDISPDFSPEWLLDLTWSELASPFISERKSPAPKEAGIGWSSLFGPFMPDEGDSQEKGGAEGYFPKSGWFRFERGGHTLFFRLDPSGAADHAGHHHNDMFHFCLFRNGVPVFIDAGRRNYISGDQWGEFGLGPQAHNSFIIGGIGAVPHPKGRYPFEYVRSENSVSTGPADGGVLEIKLSSTAFERLSPALKVCRTFFLSEKEFAFEDTFEGLSRYPVKSWLHLDNNVEVSEAGENRWDLRTGQGSAELKVESSSPLTVNMVRGGEEMSGWMAREYGRVIESTVLEIEGGMDKEYRSRFSINWSRECAE